MPISEHEIKIKRSGTKCLGGAMQSLEVSSELNGLFDVVSGVETLQGAIEYRCVYVHNTHPSLSLYNASVFIEKETPCAGTRCEVGVGRAPLNHSEDEIEHEKTAPLGVHFFAPLRIEDALLLGDIPPDAFRAVWIKRIVQAGTAAFNNDGVHIGVYGDTAA